MAYFTEKELLERYEYYTMQLEERLLEGEDFETVSKQVPFMIHLCKQEYFELVNANKAYLDLAGCELEEVRDTWVKFVANTVHPDSVKSILKFLPSFYKNHTQNQTISFVQYAKLYGEADYSPLITFTKPTKLPNGLFLWVEPHIEHFGKHVKQMEQIVRMDEFKLKHFKRYQQLTDREVEVLRLLANGRNNPQIAEELFLSRATVETHRKNLKRKLELKSFRDLMRYAFAFNLVEV